MKSAWVQRGLSRAAIAAAVVLSAGFARADHMSGHSTGRPAPARADSSSCAACCQGAKEGARGSGQGMNPEGSASAQAPGESFAVKGEIASVSPSQGLLVVVVPELGRSLNLQVNARSQLFVNGDRASLASLPQGAEVSATYVLQGDQFVAQQVNALVQGAPPAAGAQVPVPDQGTNASGWNRSVNESPASPVESPRGTLKNSDVDDRDLPGESFNVTHSTDYDSGG